MTTRFTYHFRFPIPQFNVTPWHGDMEAALQAMDNLIYTMMVSNDITLWANATTYSVGQLRIDAVSGVVYQCRVSHISASSPTTFSADRASHPTYWSEFALSINPRGQWQNDTTYAYGDWVYDATLAIIAICQTAHTSNHSGTISDDIANWGVIADFSTSVVADDIVYDNSDSGLASSNIQDAIDEIVDRVDVVEAELEEGDIIIRRPSRSITAATATIDEDDQNKTIYVDTGSNSPAITMPALSGGDAGWKCTFIKTNTGTNPMFILPDTGTLLSGQQSLAKTRRCIPGVPFDVTWSGTKWIVERCVRDPIGTIIPFDLASVPVGYELAYGQTLGSASTNYPDYYAANGNSGVVKDHRGRVMAGKDDMGGSSANRLTALSGGIDGDTLGAVGGAESHTLVTAQMPVTTPSGSVTVTITGMTHKLRNNLNTGGSTQALVRSADSNTADNTDSFVSGTATGSFSGVAFGSGNAHNIIQPSIISNMLIVVE